jgi:cellulose synthase operon protein C
MALISERMRRSDWDGALKALDAAAKKTPENTTLLELRGRVHIARNDLSAARESLLKALAIDPKFFAATGTLVAVDLLERKPEQAAQRLRETVKLDPRNYVAALALADLRGRYGASLDEQVGILRDAIKGSPGEAAPRLALIELHARNKRLTDALQVAQDAASSLPNSATVLNALASVQTQNGDVQQAISTYRRLAALDAKDVSPLLGLADLYRKTGDRANAEAVWRRVLDIEPTNAVAPTRLIESILAARKPAEALADAATMQQRQAESPIGYLLEATVHLRAKAPEKALETLRSGLKRAPANSDLALRLHQTLVATGRGPEAEKLAASWPREHPADTNFELELANGHIVRGELPAAERVLRALVARHPQAPLPLNNLAWVLATQRKPGAVDLAQRALANGRESAAMLDTLALALAADGQLGRALDAQRRAVAAAPQELNLRLNLARLAAQAGDKALARAELDQLSSRNLPPPVQAEVGRILKSL